MGIVRKIDRAFQWAGEKIGQEAKTTHSDEFKMLEQEMALRHDGSCNVSLWLSVKLTLFFVIQAWTVSKSQ